MSLPPREAWIEMNVLGVMDVSVVSLPPREAWIEIDATVTLAATLTCRFPRGKRGLKSV